MARRIRNTNTNTNGRLHRKFNKPSAATTTAAATVNNPAANNLVTVSSNATSLDSETTLTFDGTRLSVQAGVVYKRRVVTASSAIANNDYFIAVQASTTITLTLPTSTSLSAGQTFIIKDESGNAETHNITIQSTGSDTIDGQSSLKLISPRSAINLYTDAAGKYFIY